MKILLLLICFSFGLSAQIYKDPSQPIEARVADLLGRMSASEKAWQLFMVPSDFDTTKCRFTDGIFGIQLFASALSDPNQQILNYSSSNTNLELIARANDIQKHFIENTRLGIPIIFFDEGLHGLVRAQATSFPQAIGLAATFDPQLVSSAAAQIAREARLIGIRQVLSPVLNLATDVRWGRTEETFGEDPYLASQMGLAFIRPLEGAGVVCTPKHFVVNVGAGGRDSYPIGLSERALYMSHYRPFLTAFHEGNARSVMSAYNSFDGNACSSSAALLNQTLKQDFQFRGFVISDANAVGGELVLHRTATTYNESGKHALSAGLDVIFQTDCAHFQLFEPSLLGQELEQARIDSAVARVLRVKFELGLFEQPYLALPKEKEIQKLLSEGFDLAQKCAEGSIVLLKNDISPTHLPILPLAKDSKILLLGEAAAEVKLGGYSGKGFQNVSIKAGLEAEFGLKNVSYLDFPKNPWASTEIVLQTTNKWFEMPNGFNATYFDNPTLACVPVFNRNENQIDHHWTLYGPSDQTGNSFYSARWEAQLIGKQNKTIELGLAGNDGFRLFLNDTLRIDQWEKQGFHQRKIAIDVREGQTYKLRIEFREPQGNGRIKLFISEPMSESSEFYLEAEKVLDSDVAIMVVDYPEGEFQDRSSLALATAQVTLIKEIKACGIPVVVVIVGGSAVTMTDWQDDAAAILYNWYSGEAGGLALANILSGKVNPSGKLPITIPQHEGQLPLSYWHEATGRGDDYVNSSGEPLYPFGYGLSYTQFAYSQFKMAQNTFSLPNGKDTLEFSFLVQNTGAFDGAEIIQFYVKPIYSEESLPVQYLIDTKKVQLKKGETMGFVSYKIPLSKLGIPTGPGSDAYPTQFRLQIGSSSKDIRLQSQILQIQF
ncbi:MAG: glycoside hydrolase family 3 C-terminal domain-containing protein [Crocinitomicaceae bacterium]|nr:glycoside hydrolase family 3 C-terminal domain-containing protein [Crocinitomicaceae bacterium]